MPVRFTVAPHPATPVADSQVLQKPLEFLDSTWGRKSLKIICEELLQSSLQAPAHWPPTQPFKAPARDVDGPPAGTGPYLSSTPKQSVPWSLAQLRPLSNGFVDTVVQAYNEHHHLIIRPDDVWLAILSQFNLYVNANAETLRSHFVAHEGKRELVVEAVGTRYTVDFGALATQMTSEIDKNVIDKDLKDWILPDFTTTTENDTVTSAVMMMSTLKSYFNYTIALRCGIPSVTLEGDKADWQKLLTRMDRLPIFGKEPEAWSAMLRPILQRFVKAFDGEPDVDFWKHVCHYQRMGSGSDRLGGWITAFCVWDEHGKWTRAVSVDDTLTSAKKLSTPIIQSSVNSQTLAVDGITYPIVSMDSLPPGYCEVDVHLDDNGEHFNCLMVSGHMAMRVEGPSSNTVRPHPAWFMFIKGQKPDTPVEPRRPRRKFKDL